MTADFAFLQHLSFPLWQKMKAALLKAKQKFKRCTKISKGVQNVPPPLRH